MAWIKNVEILLGWRLRFANAFTGWITKNTYLSKKLGNNLHMQRRGGGKTYLSNKILKLKRPRNWNCNRSRHWLELKNRIRQSFDVFATSCKSFSRFNLDNAIFLTTRLNWPLHNNNNNRVKRDTLNNNPFNKEEDNSIVSITKFIAQSTLNSRLMNHNLWL